MAENDKKGKGSPLTITVNQTIWAYLRRLVRTGLYGNKETDAAHKLIQERIANLISSEELETLENQSKITINGDKLAREGEEIE